MTKEERSEYNRKYKIEPPIDNLFEVWVDIDEWYSVSNYGNVWSKKYGRFIGAVGINGYKMVTINKRSYLVHRLVAEKFVPNPNNLPEVDHLDTDPLNNVWTNLRWVDRKGNQNNPITIEKFKSNGRSNFGNKGDMNRWVRQYSLDGEFIAEYSSIEEAATKLGIGRTGIGNTCNHRQHSAGGFRWEFAENIESGYKSAS